MNVTFKLAWRNIWRNSRRTILTMLAVAFACAVLVFFTGLQLSSYETSINATTSVFHGQMQVQVEGYLEKPGIRKSFPKGAELRKKVSQIPGVKAASFRAIGFALASSEDRSYGVQVVGVEPKNEKHLSTIPGVIREGQYLSSQTENEAIIGTTLAKNLKIKVGDVLTLLGQGRDGSLAATVIPIVGLFESGSRELDRGLVQLPIKVFQEVFTMGSGGHSITIVGDSLELLPELQQRIQALVLPFSPKGKRLVTLRWDQLLPGLKQSMDLDFSSSWLFYFSLILVVTFSILNTFLMSVLERTREFGVMLALGSKPKQICALILYEAFLLTISGLLIGMAIGSSIILYYGANGFYIPGSEEIMKTWNLPAAVYPRVTIRCLTIGPSVILLTSLFAVIFPAFRIHHIQPTEAMRAT